MSGPDINDFLRRRIVAYYAGESESEKTDYADDMLIEIVDESIVDGTNPTPDYGTRVWNDLSTIGSQSLAPKITKGLSWEPLLELNGGGILQEICEQSKQEGTELYWQYNQ